MNDTQINLRQQAILNLLSQTSVSRSEIAAKLKNQYPISKLTLIRDLRALTERGVIQVQGVGKSTAQVLISVFLNI